MAHELIANDTMFSVKEKPWHGLGTIIENAPSIEDAIVLSNTGWTASIQPVHVFYDEQNYIPVPDFYSVVRDDLKIPMGIVKGRYQIYQNDEMWRFIEMYNDISGAKLETAGTLREGRTVWVLAKNGTQEIVKGDPIQEYFLFRNSFDGTSPISVMDTNIRVVCNNTLTAAIKRAKNMYNIKHTGSTQDRMKEVEKSLKQRHHYQEAFANALTRMANRQITETEMNDILENTIFPAPKQSEPVVKAKSANTKPTVNPVSDASLLDSILEEQEIVNELIYGGIGRAEVRRQNNINRVLELVETGSGADIPGVKGTVYGFYNAVTEFADHDRPVRVGERNEAEARFEAVLLGSAAKFKEQAFADLAKYAA